VLNFESIVIIRIKGKYLLYSKIFGGMIGYGWGNVCYILNFPPGEYLLYSQVSGRKAYYIANIPRGNVHYIVNIPGEGLLYDTGIQWVRVSRPLVFCVVIFRSLFISFLLVIVFFVPIRLPNSNYPFDVFKRF
jgi:hypothetical protein